MTRRTSTDHLIIRLQNVTSEHREFDVSVRGFGLDDRTVEQPLGSRQLAPGSEIEIPIRLGDLPVQSVNAAAEIVVIAQDRQSEQRIVSTPRYVAFSEDLAEAFVFEELRPLQPSAGEIPPEAWLGSLEARARASAEPSGRVRLENGEYLDAEGLPAPVLTAPADPQAIDVDVPPFPAHKICVRWRAEFVDPNPGQDFMNASGPLNVRAAHASVLFQTPPSYDFVNNRYIWPVILWSGTLDALGCTPWLFGFSPGQYYTTISTVLNAGDANYDVRFHEDERNYNSSASAYVTLGQPTQVVTVNTTYTDANIRTAAVLSQALVTSGLGVDSRDLEFWTADNCNGNGGCQGADFIKVGSEGGVDYTTYRHVIAHEYGHFIQRGLFDMFAHDYSKNSNIAICTCNHIDNSETNNLHCLQGQELIATTINEGFAHFIAAKIFNRTDQSDCSFSYYKEVAFLGEIDPPVTVTCQSPMRWMAQYCPMANRGVEWDWMNFFWALHTRGTNRLSMADINAVFRKACNGSCKDDGQLTFPQIDAAARDVLSAGKEAHFLGMSSEYGVNF